MFLQYAVPGALVPLYSLRLDKLGFGPVTIGVCCATQAVASVLSSLVAGQVADRWLPAERAMAVCAVLSGVSLWLLGSTADPVAVFFLTLLFWLVTGPMILLGTTVSFANLAHPERQFGPVRMWGTVGWMAVVWVIGYWLNRPEWLGWARAWVSRPDGIPLDDAPRLGAVLAFVVAGYTLTLPHTPPRPAGGKRWLAPLEALHLFRDRTLVAYLVCVLGVCVTFPFSTQNLTLLLSDLGFTEAGVGLTVSIAQVTEIILLGLLPLMLRHLGLRLTMASGLAAWLVAFAVLAAAQPTWLVVASLGLHGLYITGFLVAGQVYLNSLADGDTRASVQGVYTFVNGVGTLGGNLLAGWLRRELGGDLPGTFAVAMCIIGAALVVFVVGFRREVPRRT